MVRARSGDHHAHSATANSRDAFQIRRARDVRLHDATKAKATVVIFPIALVRFLNQ